MYKDMYVIIICMYNIIYRIFASASGPISYTSGKLLFVYYVDHQIDGSALCSLDMQTFGT